MIHAKGKVTWIDMQDPTKEDLGWLKKKFRFHRLIIDELKEFSARSRVEAYDGYLYLIYHFPVYDPVEKVSKRTEVDFLITKNEVITVRYVPLEAFDEFRKELSNKEFADQALARTLELTYRLIASLLRFNQRQLRHIQEKVEAISTELFKDREKEILKEISYLKRDISEYRIIVRPQEEILKSLLENGATFWGPTARVYLNDLIGEQLKLLNNLEAYREAISDFEDTNNQLMNVKTNEVMKTFTILAFLTFPMMLFAALFSMNVKDTPLADHQYGFWIIIAFMIFAISMMYMYFRGKDWL